MPEHSGSSILPEVKTIAAGEHFDGGMAMFDSGVSCTFAEGGEPVFDMQNGASMANVIIGPNQIDGIHCQGSCTLMNVWWSAVCEDAFTIKNQGADETTSITGGGAFGAEDKVRAPTWSFYRDVPEVPISCMLTAARSCNTTVPELWRSLISLSESLASFTGLVETAMKCLTATSKSYVYLYSTTGTTNSLPSHQAHS